MFNRKNKPKKNLYKITFVDYHGYQHTKTDLIVAKNIEQALNYINNKYDYLICVRDIQEVEKVGNA